ncbi:MAG: hypothetical protein ACRDOE_20765, partial [Streptosporangiaceae bacterium]
MLLGPPVVQERHRDRGGRARRLLFVALSVAPERLRGAHASVEHQAIGRQENEDRPGRRHGTLVSCGSP